MRAAARAERLARGREYDAFEAEWLTRKPPDEILNLYGAWPNAEPVAPVFRP
jgi:hypothetical protein